MYAKDYPVICCADEFTNFFREIKPLEIKGWGKAFLEEEKEKKETLEKRVFTLELEMKKMRETIEQLYIERSNIILMDVPKISDIEAEKQIIEYLKIFKHKTVKTVSLLNIMSELNLQPEQIERVMKKLETKGVKPIE